jgi:hypothetical protein
MVMRVVLLVGVLVVGGCGEAKPPVSEAHVALAKACVEGGGEATLCECQATKVDELVTAGDVSREVQEALVLQARGQEDAANEIMLKLPPDDLFNQPSMIAKAQLECHTPAG